MSRLTPEVIVLDKGLDLQTAKIIAPKGSVLDSLNYEQVDFQGQKRIDGFTRYDGSLLATFDEYYVLDLNAAFTDNALDVVAVDNEVFAVVLDANKGVNTIAVAIINNKLIPIVGDEIQILDSAGEVVHTYTVDTITAGSDWETTPDDHYQSLLTYQRLVRQNVEFLPGPVAGLHWFKDRLYAIADVAMVYLDESTPAVYPNDTINNGIDDAKVLDVITLPEARLLFIDAFDLNGLWQEAGREVTRGEVNLGTISAGPNPSNYLIEMASFFEARTEAQALEEDEGAADFGWRFKDLGWKVNYKNGYSLYGSLPSLNQNIDGLGTQGPTDTTNAGWPLALRQNVVITNKQTQVEGWKDSDTPTTFALDPTVVGKNAPLESEVTPGETRVIYADALISWDADLETVSAAGITTPTLESHPANATVPYIGAA